MEKSTAVVILVIAFLVFLAWVVRVLLPPPVARITMSVKVENPRRRFRDVLKEGLLTDDHIEILRCASDTPGRQRKWIVDANGLQLVNDLWELGYLGYDDDGLQVQMWTTDAGEEVLQAWREKKASDEAKPASPQSSPASDAMQSCLSETENARGVDHD